MNIFSACKMRLHHFYVLFLSFCGKETCQEEARLPVWHSCFSIQSHVFDSLWQNMNEDAHPNVGISVRDALLPQISIPVNIPIINNHALHGIRAGAGWQDCHVAPMGNETAGTALEDRVGLIIQATKIEEVSLSIQPSYWGQSEGSVCPHCHHHHTVISG